MAQIVLRFTGRFAVAGECDEGGHPTGTICMLAPRFEAEAGDFKVHHPVMTIRRDHVRFKDDSGIKLTTLQPDHRIVTDSSTREYLVWNLANRTVATKITPDAVEVSTADPSITLVSLNQLEKIRGGTAVLAEEALAPSEDGKTTTVVRVLAGQGVASRRECDYVNGVEDVNFLTYESARDPQMVQEFALDPEKQPLPLELKPADLVEFTVDLGEAVDQLTLVVTENGQEVGVVTAQTGERETIVTFTHQCGCLPTDDRHDLEFVQYYNLLETVPGGGAFVPTRAAMALSEGCDCDVQVRVDHVKKVT